MQTRSEKVTIFKYNIKMKKGCKYGTHRVIEPKGVLPQPANKIDNNMDEIYDNEVLIDVKTLNIDSASFTEISRRAGGDIEKIKGNGLMTDDFLQSLVRCARRICNECEWIEMIEFIRLHLWCTPTVHDVYLYREDFTDESFAELLDSLDLDNDEVGNEIKLYAVVDEDCLKEK